MAMFLVFLKAWLIGFAIAAPVGPIGVLCIRKTLELGLMGTFAVGIGAALADSLYGLVAATGLTALSSFLLNHAGHIKLLGGMLLLGIAYKEEHHPVPSINELQAFGHKDFYKILSEVVLLTLTNPLTIISYIGVFASIGNVGNCSIFGILSVVCGIFCGALTWWTILGTLITIVRGKLPKSFLKNVRYFSAAIIASFGLWAIYSGCSVLF